MAKLQIKSEIIASHGGIFQIMDVFERLRLGKLIDSSLGQRDASWNSFQYSEVIETVFCNYLCGGDCLEDINMLAPQFSLRPGTRIPSSDTVGRVLKSLATENISYACEKSGNSYSFNTAEVLNTLLLKMIKKLGIERARSEEGGREELSVIRAGRINLCKENLDRLRERDLLSAAFLAVRVEKFVMHFTP